MIACKYMTLIVMSHLEAWHNRANMLLTPTPRDRNGHERRRNPRSCVLCHGPMVPDTRLGSGTVLVWFRCVRCRGSQVGIWPRGRAL